MVLAYVRRSCLVRAGGFTGRTGAFAMVGLILASCSSAVRLENMPSTRALSLPPDLSPAVAGTESTPEPSLLPQADGSAPAPAGVPLSLQKLDITDQPNAPGVIWRAIASREGVDVTNADGTICAGPNSDPSRGIRPGLRIFLSCSDGQNAILQLGATGVAASQGYVMIAGQTQPATIYFR